MARTGLYSLERSEFRVHAQIVRGCSRMKFYCDSCQTKYSIADEKVRGKVLKVRCKKCSHVITVREPRAPVGRSRGHHSGVSAPGAVAPGGAPPVPPPQPKVVQWHYSINGQSFGPFDEKVLFDKIANGEIGDAAYLWNETFVDWKGVREVATFAEALAKAEKIRPSPKTLGVSRAMKAIERPADDDDDAPWQEQPQAEEQIKAGPAKERVDKKERGERTLEEAARDLEAVARKPRAAASSDRLAKLRQRLHLDESEEDELGATDVDDQTEQIDLSVAMAQLRAEEEAADKVDDIAHADTLLDSGAEQAQDLSQTPPAQKSAHDEMFSGSDGSAASRQPTPEARAAGQSAGADDEAPPSEDVVPFFPSAPKLGDSTDESDRSSTMSRVDEMTGSLLIQINAIKKDGRKRAVFAVVGGLAAVALLATVVYFAWNQVSSDDGPVDEGNRLVTDHIGQRPEFHEYSAEELAAVRDRIVLDEAVVVSREDGQAALERDESESSDSSAGSSGSSMPNIDTSALRYEERQELGGTRVRDEESGGQGSRFSRPGMIGGDDSSEPRLSGAGGGLGDDDDDRFRAMAAVQSDTQRGIYGDEYGELNPVELREGLSGAEIGQGIRRITESVGICRERHIYGGGSALDVDQIEVSITVTPDGRVGSYDISPASIKDTHFGRCMNSHTRRWGFPRFKGDPVEIQAPFALQ